MTQLNPTQILAALDPSWWIDSQQFLAGAIYQTATVYWNDLIGKPHVWTSMGPCTAEPDGSLDPDTRTNYIKDILMAETVRQIGNTGCSGGITNIEPKGFKSQNPIYFK
jgi:hypothetical protein